MPDQGANLCLELRICWLGADELVAEQTLYLRLWSLMLQGSHTILTRLQRLEQGGSATSLIQINSHD